MEKRSNTFKFIISLALAQFAGIIGSIFTNMSLSPWYAELIKPAGNPPNWVFGPVWIILYTLMGIALFLVWKKKSKKKKDARMAYLAFSLQLTLNVAWTAVFFSMQNIGGGLYAIVILLVAILATMLAFTKISKTSAWLLVPYIAWVSFATYLNIGLLILN